MAKSSFKLEHPLERRQAEAARIREKYPDRIPVIVEKAERSDIPDIDKKKLVGFSSLSSGLNLYKCVASSCFFIALLVNKYDMGGLGNTSNGSI
ncbi:putative autophagy protein Atg8 ubiquitin [Helianthus anomalus]